MVKGVGKITVPRRRMTSYERSLRDLDEGRVYEAKDVDDLFKFQAPLCPHVPVYSLATTFHLCRTVKKSSR